MQIDIAATLRDEQSSDTLPTRGVFPPHLVDDLHRRVAKGEAAKYIDDPMHFHVHGVIDQSCQTETF